MQNQNQFWYFQPYNLVANFYVFIPTNITLPFLTIYKIMTFKVKEKVFFAPIQGG
jgi:hypothetical protein